MGKLITVNFGGKPAMVTTEQIKLTAELKETKRAIRNLVNEIGDRHDEQWLENTDGDDDILFDIEPEDILRDFKENYRTPSIGIIDYDGLDGDEIIELFGVNVDRLVSLIKENCSTVSCDYCTQWDEMASVQIGEVEHQIDVYDEPELKALFDGLSDNELAAIGYKDRDIVTFYGNPCDRLILKLDAEAFLESVARVLGPEEERK
jgi:hypothetical protein